MSLLYIYLGISILTLTLFALTTMEIVCEFKRRYPDIKAPKNAFIEHVSTWFRITVTCFFPIMNIAMLWAILFDRDMLIERSITNTYLKLSREKEN